MWYGVIVVFDFKIIKFWSGLMALDWVEMKWCVLEVVVCKNVCDVIRFFGKDLF